MYILSEKQASSLLRGLTRDEVLDLTCKLETTLAQLYTQTNDSESAKLIHQPLRSVISTKDGLSTAYMPASTTDISGIKIVAIPAASEILAYINVFDKHGKLVGVVSAAEITAWRTALATMSIFMRTRLPSKKQNIVILGAGKQAEWHAILAATLCPEVSRIVFFNRGLDRVNKTSKLVREYFNTSESKVEIEAYSEEGMGARYQECMKAVLVEADCIFCCTPSTQPLFPHEFLGAKSKFISLIGSYKPHMQEVDGQTIRSGTDGKVYADLAEACLEEAGELIKAGMTKKDLVEIGEAVARGSKEISPGRGENVIFKCVGFGLMDIAVAAPILELARKQGKGTDISDF